MKKAYYVIVITMFLLVQVSYAETIRVGLEPFPPLIEKDISGYSVKLLKAVEKKSNLKFKIQIMPYNRLKIMLKNGELDLIGHTPKGAEEKVFYLYAQDIDWSIEAYTDIYMTKKIDPDLEKVKTVKLIGTPRGNKEFYSEIFGIPVENFYDGDIDNLLKMLANGRLNAFLFERASTMSTIQRLGLKGIHYRLYDGSIRAGFAVRKDDKGNMLKQRIDESIKKVDLKEIFIGYDNYIQLTESGLVR